MTRRNEFTSATKRLAWDRSNGICECHRIPNWPFMRICGRPLGTGNIHYDHIDPDYFSGCNDIHNCAALTKTCHALKTSLVDVPTIAKNKRAEDRNRGITRAPKGRPLPGTRASGWKKTFHDGWERR